MKKLILAAAIASTMTIGACSATPEKGSYAATVGEAKAAQAEATAINGNVWKQKKMKKPYVDHYLAKAEEAMKAGDEATAMKNAQLALKTAKAEVAQSKNKATPAWLK